jgi:hypothetical protein
LRRSPAQTANSHPGAIEFARFRAVEMRTGQIADVENFPLP